MSRQRIALYGQFGIGNFGNEGSLAAMLAFLRRARPEAELVCVCADPLQVSADHGVEAIGFGAPPLSGFLRLLDLLLLKSLQRFLNLLYAFRTAQNFDVMVVPGTGILDDFATTPFGAPYALYRWCMAAKRAGAKLAFVSIGAGPIRKRLSRWFMIKAAMAADFRSYRDQQSKDYMLGLGLKVEGDPIFPDIAFALPKPAIISPPGDKLTVGLGVMRYVGWTGNPAKGEAIYETYIEKISLFAAWLLDQGHRVRLLVGETIDQRAVEDVIARAGPRGGEILADEARSLSDVMAQIGAVDVVVATRFHNIVSALKMGRPTLSIGYARKNDVLLGETGLGAFCQHIEHLDVERLKTQFAALTAGLPAYGESVAIRRDAIETELASQEGVLTSGVLAEAPAPAAVSPAARTRTMNAAAGLMIARGWMSVCAFVTFFIVGRFLHAEEFGVFALATSVALVAHTLVGAGFYEYTLGRDPDGKQQGAAQTFATLSGLLALALDFVFAAIAWFVFHSAIAVTVLLAYGFTSFLWGAVVVKEAALIRDGRGGAVAAVLMAAETLGLAALVISLLSGEGVNALVASRVVNGGVVFLGYMIAVKGRFGFAFDTAKAGEMLRFSWAQMGGRLLDWANGYGGDLIIGAMLTAATVGIFRMGARLYLAGASVFIQAPTPAVLAALGRAGALGPAAMRRVAIRALRIQLGLVTPIFVAVAALAAEFVTLVLGAEWDTSGDVFAAFCLFAPAAITSIVLGSMMLASGRSMAFLVFQVVMMLPLTIAMIAGASWGPIGVSIAKAGFPLLYSMVLMFIVRELGAAGRVIMLKTLGYTAIAATVMAVWCFTLMDWAEAEHTLWMRLGLAVMAAAAGMILFGFVLRALDGRTFKLLRALTRLVLRRLHEMRRPNPDLAGVRAGTAN